MVMACRHCDEQLEVLDEAFLLVLPDLLLFRLKNLRGLSIFLSCSGFTPVDWKLLGLHGWEIAGDVTGLALPLCTERQLSGLVASRDCGADCSSALSRSLINRRRTVSLCP